MRTLLHGAEHPVSKEKNKGRKYGVFKMLFSQMVTNAGCSKSLLHPAIKVTRTAPRGALGQILRRPALCVWTLRHLSRGFRVHDISTYCKPYNTLRSILVHPKDRTPTEKKTGVFLLVYDITCNGCETARTLEGRLDELQKHLQSGHQSQANQTEGGQNP